MALEPEQFCEASSKNGSGQLQTEEIPDIQPYLMEMSLARRQPRKIHLCRSSSNVPCLPSFLKLLQNPHVWITFCKVRNPLRLPHKTTLERPKVVQNVRTSGVYTILTSSGRSRHSRVHFFHSSTAKCARRRF